MTLREYILKIGRAKAARQFNVSYACVAHWATGFRYPHATKALEIVRTTPVTWEGIYEPEKLVPPKRRPAAPMAIES